MNLTTIRSPRTLAVQIGIPPRILLEICSNPSLHYFRPKFVDRGPERPPRRIDRPSRLLKHVQRRAHEMILEAVTLPDYLHGGVPGHSPQTLAAYHLRKTCVVTIDVRDFFPSINREMVERILRREVGLGRQVSKVLAGALTRTSESDQGHTFLPQGSPASSTIANLALMTPEKRIRAHAARICIRYDRFIDDIVMSGDRVREMIPMTIGVLRNAGFTASREKLHVMSNHESQIAVGLTLNRKPSPRRAFREKCLGLLETASLEEDEQRRSIQIRSLRGMLGHAKSCAGGFSRRLEIRLTKFEQG